jgi:hypothetical protein
MLSWLLSILDVQSLLVGLVVVLLVLWLRDLKHGLHMPPGPMQWPVVGSLPSVALFGSKDFLGYLKSLGKKHGRLFTLKLGDRVAVFITDYGVMKNALVKQGDVFSVRPALEMTRLFRDAEHKGIVINITVYMPVACTGTYTV